MVLCGYLISEFEQQKLKELGAKDSKLLTDQQRRELDPKLRKMAKDFFLISISPKELNERMGETNLNEMEIEKIQQLINILKPDKVVIDSPETNTKKFAEKIHVGLKNKDVELICENYADKKFPVVSAASIIAKVSRDNEIEKISKSIGKDLGTGYPHDERTTDFLNEYYAVHGKFPEWVRTKWMTAKNIAKKHKTKKFQKNMGDFLKGAKH